MPRLTSQDASKYPAVVRYFQDYFPHVHTKSKVWKAFLKWSLLPEELARKLIASGSLPIVDFKNLTMKDGRKPNGLHRDSQPEFIFLHERIGRFYETAKRPEWKKAELVLESTVLHEMVHFGNYLASASLESKKLQAQGGAGGYTKVKGKLKEVGKMFETEAYGKDIGDSTWWSKTSCGSC